MGDQDVWKNLPIELVQIVAQRLEFVDDVRSFSCVCKSWKVAVFESEPWLHSKFPCLLLAEDTGLGLSAVKVELSSHKVFSNQDLLTLILLRVPVRKLICFASVSKLWHSLVASRRFSLLRSNCNLPLRPSGLFFQTYFVPLDNANHTTSPIRETHFVGTHDRSDAGLVRIVNSCAGLLLFFRRKPSSRYYIYNPTTKQFRTLPRNDHCDCQYIAAIAFDPAKSPYYRVLICATPVTPSPDLIRLRVLDSTYPIQKQFYIYSSEDGIWRLSGQPFNSKDRDLNFNNSVYFNGCVYWISDLVRDFISDKDDSSCYYYNLGEEKLETMPRPPRSSQNGTSYIGVSQNHLHIVEVSACESLLNVYEMESNCSGWFLKYEVDLSPISQVFPEMIMIRVDILSLVRRDNFEEDSFLVLHIPGNPCKAIHYNLVDHSFKEIWERKNEIELVWWFQRSRLSPVPRWKAPTMDFSRIKHQGFEFIESLSCV